MAVQWRQRLGRALRIAVLCLPIVAAFAFFMLPIASALAWYRGTAVTDAANLFPAVICGLIAGLFVVVFHVKRETTVLPFKNRQDFLAACRLILDDLGYEVAEKPEGCLVSLPSFRALLLGGHIHIQPTGHEARIAGPKVFVEILRSRLRLHSHITGVEQTLRDSRVRQIDRLYKRIEVSLRLTPAQWTPAGEAVLQKLVDAGAEVVCEVHLLAHSPKGIHSSIIEGPVKEWLQKQGIQAEVHKDHSCWDEAVRGQNVEDTVVLDDHCSGSMEMASAKSAAV